MYVLAILLPWLAVLLCGRPLRAVPHVVVWLLFVFVFPPVLLLLAIDACVVVSQRNRRLYSRDWR